MTAADKMMLRWHRMKLTDILMLGVNSVLSFDCYADFPTTEKANL